MRNLKLSYRNEWLGVSDGEYELGRILPRGPATCYLVTDGQKQDGEKPGPKRVFG